MRTLHSCWLWHRYLAELICRLCRQGVPCYRRLHRDGTVQYDQHSWPHGQC